MNRNPKNEGFHTNFDNKLDNNKKINMMKKIRI